MKGQARGALGGGIGCEAGGVEVAAQGGEAGWEDAREVYASGYKQQNPKFRPLKFKQTKVWDCQAACSEKDTPRDACVGCGQAQHVESLRCRRKTHSLRSPSLC